MDIREIAKRARVSTATVSRAINRIPTVNPQLAKRVWNVIDQLGNYPNTQARALVSGLCRHRKTAENMSRAELARLAFHALLAEVRRETPSPALAICSKN